MLFYDNTKTIYRVSLGWNHHFQEVEPEILFTHQMEVTRSNRRREIIMTHDAFFNTPQAQPPRWRCLDASSPGQDLLPLTVARRATNCKQTAVELTRQTLARIELNPKTGALITVSADQAMDRRVPQSAK
jgi:hypothetical protein